MIRRNNLDDEQPSQTFSVSPEKRRCVLRHPSPSPADQEDLRFPAWGDGSRWEGHLLTPPLADPPRLSSYSGGAWRYTHTHTHILVGLGELSPCVISQRCLMEHLFTRFKFPYSGQRVHNLNSDPSLPFPVSFCGILITVQIGMVWDDKDAETELSLTNDHEMKLEDIGV